MDFGIIAGDTDQTIYVRLRDSATGLAKTGLAYNSAGAVCSYVLPGAARAAITLATQTVTGAHSDGGFVEVDATNCKGLYRLDLPDAAIASGKFSLISIEFDGIIEETVIVPLTLRKSNVIQLSDDATAANNAEAFFDGTGYAGTNNVIPTVTTLTGHTPQTGDSYAIVNSGTHGNAALKTLIDTIDNIIDTEFPALVTTIGTPAGASIAADIAANFTSIEIIRNSLVVGSGTVNDASATTTAFNTDLTQANDYWNDVLLVFDSGALTGQVRPVLDFANTNGRITLDEALTAAPANGATFRLVANHIHPTTQIADAILDRSASGHTTNSTLGAIINDWEDGGRLDLLVDDLPTTAEFEARTLVAANYFDPSADAVANVTTVGSVTGAVGSVTGNVGGNVTGSVGSLATQAKADVNAEVLDVLNTDTFAEPGQEAPAATNTLAKKIGYIFKFLRNKLTQSSTEFKVFADDGTTVDQKATVSDDGTTTTRGEIGSGP